MEQDIHFIKPSRARDLLNVSDSTLRRWVKEGKIRETRAEGSFSHRRYDISSIIGKATLNSKLPPRKVCYCRVSSRGQKEDLRRQEEFFKENYPEHQIITDYGSGLNFKRKGLKTILEYSLKGNLKEIVVTYKDRLARFGFEILEFYFQKLSGTKIVVLNKNEASTPYEELVEDILSITTVFSSRLYGMRSHSTKKEIKISQDKISQDKKHS